MDVRVVVQPAALVTASVAKLQAPVLSGEPDARVTALLAIAQGEVERSWVGRAFGEQTLELSTCAFDSPLRLPYPPLKSVTNVRYLDRAGVEQTVPPSSYVVQGVGTSSGRIALARGASWPDHGYSSEAVRVLYIAGYAANDPDLEPVRHAIVLGATLLRSLSTVDLALRSESVDGVGSQTFTVSDAAEKLMRSAAESLLQKYRVYA